MKGASEMPEGPKAVHVEKIDNGFIVKTCGYGKEETKFVKDLASTPTIMARLLGVKGEKNADQLSKMTKVEEVEEEEEE